MLRVARGVRRARSPYLEPWTPATSNGPSIAVAENEAPDSRLIPATDGVPPGIRARNQISTVLNTITVAIRANSVRSSTTLITHNPNGTPANADSKIGRASCRERG